MPSTTSSSSSAARSWISRRSSAWRGYAAAGLGIVKLRVTGGEPLVRRDLPELIRRLVAIPAIRDLASPPTACCCPLWRSRSTRPACAASTSTSTPSTASDSSKSRAATKLTKVIAGLDLCKRLGYSKIKLNRGGGERLVERISSPWRATP